MKNILNQILVHVVAQYVAAGLTWLVLVLLLRPVLKNSAFFSVNVPLWPILLLVIVIFVFSLIRHRIMRLGIHSANYGFGAFQNEVTDGVRTRVDRGVLRVLATTAELCNGNDPAPGHTKALTINYTLNGRERTIQIIEGSQLTLP